jgi:dTDP-glucose 4,6-dehydratase
MINNIIHNKPLPVYGEGKNVRDWLFVKDHATAIERIFTKGKIGETYNIGGHNEWTNIDLVNVLCDVMDEKLGRKKGESKQLITYVKDRAGHDLRYAIDATKLKEGLRYTVDWFLNNSEWLEHVTSGDYRNYYDTMYK